jgi:hypothetical protein
VDSMELVAKLAEINSWMAANSGKKRLDLSDRQAQLLRNLTMEFAYNMHLLLPPGDACACCNGTGTKPGS